MRARVANVHQRSLPASAARVSAMLDTLATSDDSLWPVDDWPRMRFDGGLRLGALGGHGPIRYRVAELEPGRRVRFAFLSPRGLPGDHWLEVVPEGEDRTLLRHGLVAQPRWLPRLMWVLVWGPLHDALIEDALTRAHTTLTGEVEPTSWSLWVRFLRRVLG